MSQINYILYLNIGYILGTILDATWDSNWDPNWGAKYDANPQAAYIQNSTRCLNN